ncbi:MAG: type IX secretion system sortase PorU [Prolixibacteraceae bacterium]
MLRIILFNCLIFCVGTTLSNDFHRKIRWIVNTDTIETKTKQIFSLKFDGSVVIDYSELPYWFESFELNLASADVVIVDAIFEPVNNSIPASETIQNEELTFKSDVGVSAGKSFLRLTVFPFIRKNNQVEKLVSFTISITETQNKLKSAFAAFPWKTTSVLSSGKWIKIKTKDRGIYKVTYDQIKQWGFANPDQVALYGTGGYMLPFMNKDLRFDDLDTYPAWKGKDNAGKDCLFFYSTGNIQVNQDLTTGTFSHQQNYYATETYFYLTDQGTLKTIGKIAEVTGDAGRKVLSFPNYTFYEKESINLISSGSQWYGERFITGATQSINISLENPELTKPAIISVTVAGRTSTASNMDVVMNGKSILNLPFGAYREYEFARQIVKSTSTTLQEKNIQLKLTYQSGNSSSEAWLDYISVNYQSLLNMNSDVYSFRGRGVDGQIPISEFVLSNVSASTRIFDVTDPAITFEVPANYAEGQLKFKSNSGLTREYVAFNPGGTIPSAELVGNVANQNLHASELSEMIIVSNSTLLKVANDLADLHRTSDQMTVQVVTPEVIYNEFSGGLPDPSAFRNYFRMCYDQGKQTGKNTLRYVLLMGDGSFDNRNIQKNNLNLLPTFQSDNSLIETESFVTDDFFVFMDENEGGSYGTVDLGIGRIPARTIAEAEIVLDKIKTYPTKESIGNWRNVVTFIADDGNTADGYTTIHTDQAESLARFVNKTYPAFFTERIYLDTYKRILTAGGEKYPDVNVAIDNRVKRGSLIMNYTGHGNAKGLADESIIDIGSINSWTNYNRLAIFVTATCEFSRFDDNETSAGEYVLFSPNGGGVGLFSTTRLVYSGANFVLNSKFFKYIFEKDQQGNNLRLGDVMRLAKASANTGINQLNFTLLADPALRLANPNNQVVTTSINGNDAKIETDTINTLSVVTVKGYVANSQGVKLTSFNGEITPSVYDKAIQLKTLGNAGQETTSFTLQNNVIYKGLASVKNGEFEFSFFVPKETSYKLGKGNILYYAYNELVDASGYFDNFYLGGSLGSSISDTKGPKIDLYMNSESFKDGGTVSASSVLLANITDENGINTSGIGIGHDITAILDGENSNILILNDYFQSDKDSYTSGKIVFPLTKLSEGEHVLKIKVWDVFNNSSEKEIKFVVKDDFRIETVSAYPNPMQGETRFVFTHNQPDEIFNVELEVFQSTGSRVDLVKAKVSSQGIESLPLEWIPAERQVKMKSGVYIYRISATTKDGKRSSGSGRLVFQYR